MNNDRSLERAARSWLEEGPTSAPDRVVDAALTRIQTTRQERDLVPWRLPTMNPIARLAMVAVVAAIAVGGSLYLIGRQGNGIGGQSTPSPTAAPPSAAPTRLMAGPLPMGTYVGPTLQVADLVSAINADPGLTASQRTRLIDESFAIKDRSTWSASIELLDGQWIQRQTVDGFTQVGSVARYSFPDERTVVLTETVDGTDRVTTRFELTIDGDSFSLRRLTPASSAEEELVLNVLFESGPFTLR